MSTVCVPFRLGLRCGQAEDWPGAGGQLIGESCRLSRSAIDLLGENKIPPRRHITSSLSSDSASSLGSSQLIRPASVQARDSSCASARARGDAVFPLTCYHGSSYHRRVSL